MGKDVRSIFDVVHPAFLPPTTVLPNLPGALKDGSGEAVVAWDIPELCEFLSLNGCQERFMWAHKEVDLVLHPPQKA